MGRNLHTAKTYNVKYGPALIAGWNSEECVRRIFNFFDVEICGEEYASEYEVPRSDLIELKETLENRTVKFTDNESDLNEELSTMDLTLDDFIIVIHDLITTSDQNSEYVLLSWY